MALSPRTTPYPQSRPIFDVQFFGDVMIPQKVTAELVRRQGPDTSVFDAAAPILQTARENVVNLEGPLTLSDSPYTGDKKYILKMLPDVTDSLRRAGITAVTLANNHSMDYGPQGLEDTLTQLRRAGIRYTGAGKNLALATTPTHLSGGICIVAINRTFPHTYWALSTQAGTAHAKDEEITRLFAQCAEADHKFLVVHWGSELSREVQKYQRTLAHAAIEAGATAVIGHHPHILQEIEVYKDRPIFYSLGNFAFGSLVHGTSLQEGIGVAISLRNDGKHLYRLTPMNVYNAEVRFQPRPVFAGEPDALRGLLPKKCQQIYALRPTLGPIAERRSVAWECRF